MCSLILPPEILNSFTCIIIGYKTLSMFCTKIREMTCMITVDNQNNE